MYSRFNEELFIGVMLIFGVVPGFFLAVLALGLLAHGISNVDVSLIAFGTSALIGYVGGLIVVFSSLEFRAKYNTLLALPVSVGVLALVVTIPTVLSIAIYNGRSWPAVMVFSTLACATGLLIRQLKLWLTMKSGRRIY